MTKNTLTQARALDLAIRIINGNPLPDDVSVADLTEKLTTMHDKICAKRSTVSKATSERLAENARISDIILETLLNSENPMTITEMQKSNEELAVFSNQKLSALLAKLVESAQVTREVIKRVTYFSISNS